MKANIRLPEAYKKIIKQESTKQCREMLDSLCEEHDAMLFLALNELEGWKYVPFVRLMKKLKELKAHYDAYYREDLDPGIACYAARRKCEEMGIDLKKIYLEAGIDE